MNIITKIIGIFSIVLILFSCTRKIDQSSMFSGRAHKTKKRVEFMMLE